MNFADFPGQANWAEFDALHDEPAAWLPAVQTLAARWGVQAMHVVPVPQSTALVVLLGDTRVLKVYPPFLRDHWDYERAALPLFHGQLELPTPQLLDSGEEQGWLYLLLTRLPGLVLTEHWALLSEPQRITALHTLGRVTAQAHARVDVGDMRAHAPAWPAFVAQQRQQCLGRQQRTGLPQHLLTDVEHFLDAGPIPGLEAGGSAYSQAEDVALTGEYTPMNLLVQDGRLCGMFDFGDGLVGPRLYDWLGPLVFFAAGHASRVDAYLSGYRAIAGDAPQWRGRVWRDTALRLMLLHRYSCLKAQIACPGWDDPHRVPDFKALALYLWPDAGPA